MPSGDELSPSEAQPDLRDTLNERRNLKEVEITRENFESIVQESSQTMEEEPDLRAILNKNKPTTEEEISNSQEEPSSEED